MDEAQRLALSECERVFIEFRIRRGFWCAHDLNHQIDAAPQAALEPGGAQIQLCAGEGGGRLELSDDLAHRDARTLGIDPMDT